MSGSSDSLRKAMEDLCQRAAVELRAFDAVDRPIAAAPARPVTPPTAPVRVASGFDFGPNPRLVETALTSRDPIARGRARQVIFEALREDPSPLQRFVQKDTEQVVSELVDFPHAAEFLRNLQAITVDPDERGQLQVILGHVQVRQAGD